MGLFNSAVVPALVLGRRFYRFLPVDGGVQMIGPRLHERSTLRQPTCGVIAGPYSVTLDVGEGAFYMIDRPVVFIRPGGERPTHPMATKPCIAYEPQSDQHIINGGVAHVPDLPSYSPIVREYPFGTADHEFVFPENSHCLSRKWHDMR